MNQITTQPPLYTTVESPIGELLLAGDGAALNELHMHGAPRALEIAAEGRRDHAGFREARDQLGEYFAGTRRRFELALQPAGSVYQRRVWKQLEQIGFGETITYAELARRVGRTGSARAVGAANGRNPISIIIPCHRVIGADGTLTGYSGGIRRKRTLLELEGVSL